MTCSSTPAARRCPKSAGQPCPPGIAPIELSATETARIERLARDRKAGLLTAVRLAFHLRWSHWRRRHQARARWHHYAARLSADACGEDRWGCLEALAA